MLVSVVVVVDNIDSWGRGFPRLLGQARGQGVFLLALAPTSINSLTATQGSISL